MLQKAEVFPGSLTGMCLFATPLTAMHARNTAKQGLTVYIFVGQTLRDKPSGRKVFALCCKVGSENVCLTPRLKRRIGCLWEELLNDHKGNNHFIIIRQRQPEKSFNFEHAGSCFKSRNAFGRRLRSIKKLYGKCWKSAAYP